MPFVCRGLFAGLLLAAAAHASQAPVVISVEPARIPPAGGVRVIIAGENFQPGAVVRLCGERVADATWVTRNQIDFVAPQRTAGACEVTVQNADGQAARMPALFAYSELPPEAYAGAPSPWRPMGAPLPPPALAPVRSAPPQRELEPRPAAAERGPERAAAEFMARLIGKQDTTPLHHARMRSPLPAGVTFGWQFSEGFAGTFAGVPILHYEGRLESINSAGLRAWFPFVVHVTQERPSLVTGLAVSTDPAASRQSLVAAIEQEQGVGVIMNLDQPIRPLP